MYETHKKIVKLLLLEIVVIASIIYFTRADWYTKRSGTGHLSKDTYLSGGTGKEEIEESYRVYYQCVINSGSMCIEIKDEEGNIVKRKIISETEDGYIYFDDLESGTYYETEYSLTDDTDAYFSVSVQTKINNLQKTINSIIYIG